MLDVVRYEKDSCAAVSNIIHATSRPSGARPQLVWVHLEQELLFVHVIFAQWSC